jgi:hypothetical protein
VTQTNEAMQGRGEFASRDNRTFLASMLTSLLAVAICSYGIVFMQNRVANEGARATTSAVTQVIAYNLAAPVAFGDMDAARDVLASLESRPDIKAVKILDHRDAVLSIYVPGKTDLSFYRRAAAYKDLIAEDAHLSTAPIELDDEVLGRLEIVSKDTVQGQIHDAGREFAVLIAAFALACSFCLSSIIFLVLRTNAAKAEELTPEPQLSPVRES